MNDSKLELVEGIPPFKIHSTLYRTVYVTAYPPYVRMRTILNLGAILCEGEAEVTVSVCGIRSREILGADPTLKTLIDTVRMVCQHVAFTLDRIQEVENGRARRTIATLVSQKVFWNEPARCFQCNVEDLAEDMFPPDDIKF